ncbi:CTP synthetase [Roseovarius sp. ZX-A-9]|uniref:CTP synthetase n=1 Tax=Roseovarius sp. ZX-A-9 TaxID=3014783 RepID=UPI00232F831D|nr:CTP synthetase [Roseovarius sp. ZX-A-9]
MAWLTFVVHLLVGATLAGVGVIVALVLGYDTLRGVLTAAAAGFVLSVPATWLVARKISRRK